MYGIVKKLKLIVSKSALNPCIIGIYCNSFVCLTLPYTSLFIIPNIVPTVLQYNVQKNGYYILDWWPKAKDINGQSIYSSEKLLKIVIYIMT